MQYDFDVIFLDAEYISERFQGVLNQQYYIEILAVIVKGERFFVSQVCFLSSATLFDANLHVSTDNSDTQRIYAGKHQSFSAALDAATLFVRSQTDCETF